MRHFPQILGLILLAFSALVRADFADEFDGDSIHTDWQSLTGDGKARLTFEPRDGHASMVIDARPDRHNVWWTVIKRNIAEPLDLEKLSRPDYEL